MSDTYNNEKDDSAPASGNGNGGWLQKLLSRKPAATTNVKPEAPLPTTPAGIAKEIIEDIALCQLKGELPTGTKFSTIASLQNKEKGTRAFAYQNNLDTNEIRLVFPGRSAGVRGIGTPVENSTAAAVVRGRPSYQVAVVEEWMQETIIPWLKNNPGRKVRIFGHSMGSGNAIAAKHLLDKNGIASETMLIEPFAPTQAARYILEKDLTAITSKISGAVARATVDEVNPTEAALRALIDEAKIDAIKRLQKGITSIRSYPTTAAARHPVGNSLSNNKQFGEQAFFLSATPDRPANEGMSRRDILALPKRVFSAPGKMISKGTLEDDEFTAAGHTLQSCRKVLEALGDKAVQPARAGVLSSPEQVLHPERYPVPAGAVFAEELTTGYYKGLR